MTLAAVLTSATRRLSAAHALPPRELAQRLARVALRAATDVPRRAGDLLRETYGPRHSGGVPLRRWLGGWTDRLHVSAEDAARYASLAEHYLAHRFDLLGSGWVVVSHGRRCQGLEGIRYAPHPKVGPDARGDWLAGRVTTANWAASARAWSLIEGPYVPIDWHLDFKSGYRWSERTWYRDVPFGHLPGVDIKVPWELARAQHLPQLAVAHHLASRGDAGFADPHAYVDEFRNEVLDFIATNPPRFGANWQCAMDVGIRIANWLLAHDLFRSAGATFDAEFERELAGSTFDHAHHIAANLEGTPAFRSNHYLADLVGLLIAALYLPRGSEPEEWVRFCRRELEVELTRQFNPDGSNFEGSTSYHRLSSELIVFAAAFLAAADAAGKISRGRSDVFPHAHADQLWAMARFTLDVTKPDGRVAQVGDNDSGRLFKLSPTHAPLRVSDARKGFSHVQTLEGLPDDATFWLEDHLDQRSLVTQVGALLGRSTVDRTSSGGSELAAAVDAAVVGTLRGSTALKPSTRRAAVSAPVAASREWRAVMNRLWLRPGVKIVETTIPAELPRLLVDLRRAAYPDFGLYVFRSPHFFLSVRCGPIGQDGRGGHAHNDQLSLELQIDGVDVIADPGTYLYTPLPQRRDQYRSVRAHAAPQALDGREPARLGPGPFRLEDKARATCQYFGEEGFIGSHQGFGEEIHRIVDLTAHDMVRITDIAPPAVELVSPLINGAHIAFSPGYGLLRRIGG